MIKKLHKIPDKVYFNAVFLLIILWNLKYFFLPIQVPFTLLTQDYMGKNKFHAVVEVIGNATQGIKSFQDEGKTGFVSDIPQSSVFDLPESITIYYLVQYAIVPSILKNDTEENYVIGAFFKKENIPEGFSPVRKISSNLYILKKDNK